MHVDLALGNSSLGKQRAGEAGGKQGSIANKLGLERLRAALE